MICPNCGAQNQEGMRFCPSCGTPLTKTTPLASEQPSVSEEATLLDPRMITTQEAPIDDLAGQILDNKYQIISRLSSGGMGTVYRAKRLHIDDTIAVKVLHKKLVGDNQAIERFRREAKAAARLKHANAVAIYDSVVSTSGHVYIAMELVEGRSLGALIREQGYLSPKYAASIFVKVCSALDEAHRQNIVHRDLKPDNILVDTTKGDPAVKVLDFGIAKLRDMPSETTSITQKGMLLGTPMYMSPEQCMGEEIDGRSDIYSLGIILYEMLTGVLPFDSPTPTAVIVQHVTKEPPSLREINSHIPPSVENVVLHALQKRKEDRPQTPGAMAEELLAAVNSSLPQHSSAMGTRNSRLVTHRDVVPVTADHLRPVGEADINLVREQTPTARENLHQVKTENQKSPRAALILLVLLASTLLIVSAILLINKYTNTSSQATNSSEPAPAQEPDAQANPTASPMTPPKPPVGMAYVAGGEFLMGRLDGGTDESPQHQVTVKPFFVDIYEVTCADYQKFLKATGHTPPAGWNGTNYPAGWARRPVINVDWNSANAYANWAGKRLPTEAEWEFAARSADGRLYPWGNQWRAQAANAHTTSHHHPDNVGSHKSGASPFGAYDMVGNAWEWTSSDLQAYPGGSLSGSPEGEMKVLRGGSCLSDLNEATTTFRKGVPPTGGDYQTVGFRCIKDIPASENTP